MSCATCGRRYKPGAAFCAECGRQRVAPDDATGELRFAIRFYLALLAVQVVALIYARVGGKPFTINVAATAGLAGVTFVVASVRLKLVTAAYARAGFSPVGYMLVLVAAPVVLALVLGYVYGLAHGFGLHVPRELDDFKGHHIGWAIGLVVIAPPVFEELAFRGLLYGALARSLRRSETYIISSFAFALLHLSVPSLVTHLPLGLYLCWLRERSGSMYPSMFAHGCHNLGVFVLEATGWA